MRPEPSETTKRNVTSMLFSKKAKAVVSASFTSPEQILGEIYELMVKMEEQRKLEDELKKSEEWDRQDTLERRNQELIKALTGRKKPKKKVVEEKKKEVKQDVEKKAKKVEKETQAETTAAPKEPAKAPKETAKQAEPPKQVAEKPPEVKPTPEVGPTPGLPRTRVRAGTKEPTAPATTPPVKVAPVKPAAPVTPPVSTAPIIPKIAGVAVAASASSVIAKEEGVLKDKKTGQVSAYWDPPGQKNLVSIGYGHQIKEEEYKQGFIDVGGERISLSGDRGIDTRMSMDQAKKLLEIDIPKYEKRAKDPLGDSWNKLTDGQKTALISYAYNTGSTSSLVKMGLKDAIDRGDFVAAAEIIREKGIRTSKGEFNAELDKRRRREADMFQSNIKQQPIQPTPKSSNLEETSRENQQLNASLDAKSKSTSVNNTNISVQKSQQTSQPKVEDDRPIIIKKAQQ